MAARVRGCDDAFTNCRAPLTGARRRMMTLNNYGAIAAVSGMLVLGSVGTALATREARPESHALKGTWLVEVQQRICTTEAPLGAQFYALLTFAGGGTMSGTTSSPLFAPGQRTGDFGVWSFSGHRTFSAVSEAFLLADSASTPPGLKRGLQRIAQTITIPKNDPNTFNSVATVEFFDTNSNLLISGCATATGQRFE
jgi:hypothetical protein